MSDQVWTTKVLASLSAPPKHAIHEVPARRTDGGHLALRRASCCGIKPPLGWALAQPGATRTCGRCKRINNGAK